jgi:hypothetical protein
MIEIQIYGYYTLLGVASYVFDDDRSVKSASGCKIIELSSVSTIQCVTFATFGATADPKTIEIQIYSKHTLSGSQMALSGYQNTLSGSQMALSCSHIAPSDDRLSEYP